MDTVLASLACALCVPVALCDLYARRVPNRLLLAALVAAMLALGWMQADAIAWRSAALGLLCAAALLPCYAIGWMGAGDVKFFGVLGALVGPSALLAIWIVASLLAGVHAMAVLATPRLLTRLPLGLRFAMENGHARLQAWPPHRRMRDARGGRRGIPYASYLAGAALLYVFAAGPWT